MLKSYSNYVVCSSTGQIHKYHNRNEDIGQEDPGTRNCEHAEVGGILKLTAFIIIIRYQIKILFTA